MRCLIFSMLIKELSNRSRIIIILRFVNNHCRCILTFETFIFIASTAGYHLDRLSLLMLDGFTVFLRKLLV